MASSSSHPTASPHDEPPPSDPRNPAPREAGGIGPDERPPWPIWTAPAAVALGLVLGSLGTIVVDIVASAGGSSVSHPSPAATIVADIVFDLCFVAAALWLAWWRGRRAARGLRLSP